MPHLRFVLAWLIMLAIPMQGLAAASMAICAGEHHAVASRQEARSGGGEHDHASHAHLAEQSFGHAPLQPDDRAAEPDTAHKCGGCSTCCHSPALTEHHPGPKLAALDQAAVTAPFLAVVTAPSRLPDKPPRA